MSAVLSAHVQAPDHWHAQAIEPYRACVLCHSRRTAPDGIRTCTHTSVAWAGQVVLVERARAQHGACGPEAIYLNFPGLE